MLLFSLTLAGWMSHLSCRRCTLAAILCGHMRNPGVFTEEQSRISYECCLRIILRKNFVCSSLALCDAADTRALTTANAAAVLQTRFGYGSPETSSELALATSMHFEIALAFSRRTYEEETPKLVLWSHRPGNIQLRRLTRTESEKRHHISLQLTYLQCVIDG